MPEDEHSTPTTVRELGIEFRGFRTLVDERFTNLSADIKRLAAALEESNKAKADKDDLTALTLRVLVLENKKPYVLVLSTVILSSVITFFLTSEIGKLFGK